MSKDISITDLIAKLRKLEQRERVDHREHGPECMGAPSWETRLSRDLALVVDALEAVTVPTENEREVLEEIFEEAGHWAEPKDLAAALIARGFRLPVPVEPEKPVALKGEPHSRACGWRLHDHGTECHTNCPTCEGGTQ
jgi:hypothetical protein